MTNEFSDSFSIVFLDFELRFYDSLKSFSMKKKLSAEEKQVSFVPRCHVLKTVCLQFNAYQCLSMISYHQIMWIVMSEGENVICIHKQCIKNVF